MTATDDAFVLAGTDGGRPRCTRAGPDGVDLWQVSDTGAVPEIATGSSRNPFPPIADYAFLSDCESTCLISSAGSVEWLCVPRPDSPSVFGALLDRSAGHFRFGPYGVSVPAARRYLPGSLILETTWQTHTGWLIVRDALVMGPWHDIGSRSPTHRRTPMDWDAEHILLRTVRCVSGTVELVMNCEPSFDYHRVGASWEYCGNGYGEAIAAAQRDPDTHPKLTAHDQSAAGSGGPRGPRPYPDERGRQRLCRAVLVHTAAAADLRAGRQARCGRPAKCGGNGSTWETSRITRGGHIYNAVR